MSGLAPDKKKLLIKLLGMMGSAHDGEVLAAARKAQALVRECGVTWEDVMQTVYDDLEAVVEKAFSAGHRDGYEAGKRFRPLTWQAFAHQLKSEDLSAWEENFVTGFIAKGWGRPTEKQQAVFQRMADKFGLRIPDGEIEDPAGWSSVA